MNKKVIPKTKREKEIEALAIHLYDFFDKFSNMGKEWDELEENFNHPGVESIKNKWRAVAVQSYEYLKGNKNGK